MKDKKTPITEKDIQKQVNELISLLNSSTADKKRKDSKCFPLTRFLEMMQRMKKVEKTENNNNISDEEIKNLVTSLDDLRLKIKYILFDLEATKRENSYFKNMLGHEGNEE